MLVSKLDSNGDWEFGQSLNNYVINVRAIEQSIQTRVSSFLGDCFFDMNAGIDWFNFLGGSKSQLALELAVASVILNTTDVVGINLLSVSLTAARAFSVSYQVQTTYSTSNNEFVYSLGG